MKTSRFGLLFLLLLLSEIIYPQWQMIRGPIEYPVILKTAHHPQGYQFAFTKFKEIYRSDSTGNNWIKVSTVTSDIQCFCISPKGDLYLGINYGYLISTDLGSTWKEKQLTSTGYITNFLFENNGTIYASFAFLANQSSFWKSTDFGENWSAVGCNKHIKNLKKDSKGNFYIISMDKLYFSRSTNGGIDWEDIYWPVWVFNTQMFSLAVDSLDNIYVALSDYLWKYTDDCKIRENIGYLGLDEINNVYIDSLNNFYYTGSQTWGIRYSSDMGLNWSSLGLEGYIINELSFADNVIYAATEAGILKSSDHGLNWTQCFAYEESANVNWVVSINNTKLITGNAQGIFSTVNYGKSWDSSSVKVSIRCLKKSNNGILYASTTEGLYRSIDSGLTWTKIHFAVTDFFVDDKNNISVIYTFAGDGGIQGASMHGDYSTDAGNTWTMLFHFEQQLRNYFGHTIGISPSGSIFIGYASEYNVLSKLPNDFYTIYYRVNHIYFFNDSLYLALGSHPVYPAGGVRKSGDDGKTLISINNGLKNLVVRQLLQVSPNLLLCVTNDGLYQTTNYGNLWHQIDLSDVSNPFVNSISYENGILYAATDKGIAKYCNYTLIDDIQQNFSSFDLKQNYPNPFNPLTTIEFFLPKDEKHARLIIFNELGQKVSELLNGSIGAGTHQFQWNASNLASGIYFYQLRTEELVSTKKMLFIK